MDFLVNDLSCHGQFQNVSDFRDAIRCMMQFREIARRHSRTLYCHQQIAHAVVNETMTMQQAVSKALNRDEQRALLQWITKQGPFWDDLRQHSPDDYMICNGDIVTDTAIGEAAWCLLNGIDRGIVSFSPSAWCCSPISVDHVLSQETRQTANLQNHWIPADFELALDDAPLPISSWEQLEMISRPKFQALFFAQDAFAPLQDHPFSSSAAERIRFLLHTLNRFVLCHDPSGKRNSEGQEIYQSHFTGKKGDGGRGASFTDSSNTEKNVFEKSLTFTHPQQSGTTIFCPWHGKVQTPQLRVHFSWPVKAGEPLFIVYVGPKITKK